MVLDFLRCYAVVEVARDRPAKTSHAADAATFVAAVTAGHQIALMVVSAFAGRHQMVETQAGPVFD